MNFVFNSYFEYADGIKMWVRVFSVFVCGLKLARVDNTLWGELSIQNKTLSAFISWYCRLDILFLAIEYCELTLSIQRILRETLFIFILFSSTAHLLWSGGFGDNHVLKKIWVSCRQHWWRSKIRFCFCCQFEGILS